MLRSIKIEAGNLKRGNWHEYAVRFLLGGLITVAAGFIADSKGPAIGGLFLAFPAILPATVTLIAKHEREKKAAKGLHGGKRALDAAALDTNGASLGSAGLLGFAATAWCLLPRLPAPLALLLATVAWLLLAVAAWVFRKNLPRMRSRKFHGQSHQA